IAIVFEESHLTYGALARRVGRLANELHSRGVGKGHRVVWLGPNHPAFLGILFAAANIGAIVSPINHRLDSAMVQTLCDEVDPIVVFRHASCYDIPIATKHAATVVVGGSDAALPGENE